MAWTFSMLARAWHLVWHTLETALLCFESTRSSADTAHMKVVAVCDGASGAPDAWILCVDSWQKLAIALPSFRERLFA